MALAAAKPSAVYPAATHLLPEARLQGVAPWAYANAAPIVAAPAAYAAPAHLAYSAPAPVAYAAPAAYAAHAPVAYAAPAPVAYAAPAPVAYAAPAPVAHAITKTVHYAETPVVTGYTSTIVKPDLGRLATPAHTVSQTPVVAPARAVQTVVPQVCLQLSVCVL